VDGTSYEYMGDSPSVNDLHKAIPLTVSYDSQYVTFLYELHVRYKLTSHT
jgi:hypothetical protein